MSRRTFLAGLLIIALLVFSLYKAKYGARESAEEIAAVEAEIEDAINDRALLLGELSHLSRQEWVEDYARKELGMVQVRADQFVREEDLGHVLGPVEPADAQDPSSEMEGLDER